MHAQESQSNSLNPNVPASCTCFSLRKATRVITQFFDERLQSSGLLVNQFTLLAALSQAGSPTMKALAQILVMDRTTLTRNLKPLQRQGLIAIEPGQDQRERIVTLTAAGQSALVQAFPLWKAAQQQVVERLGTEQWQMLLFGLANTVSLVRETVVLRN
ncbi:MAG: winged helix-turn-helix transcriptional regulator [Leptolyngbyaceae cyanobacterium RM1_406_9]|nr:winged helix-turn-helix transcriptional regulator [Leptolyngbyaceae cyanobacterium SM1_4_3]NJN90122.1 winged helix-turn-helix transcriptional regulator [Leptolyngbyaceae cyanobacterium SL_5_14]NJO73151.1 winged helix-turn-helix transcriptional regulator [Leptolyngbyaceae cyanobacterium RM1_406_9]